MNIGMFVTFGIIITAILTFNIIILMRGGIRLIHILYIVISGIMVVWLLALSVLMFYEDNYKISYIMDAISNVGNFLPPVLMLISLVFILGWEKLPKWWWILFIEPIASFIVICTNPLHNMHYEVFSIDIEKIKFGPLFYVNGMYAYICYALSIIIIVYFITRKKHVISKIQAAFFAAGNFLTILVNILAVSGVVKLTIYSTPFVAVFGVLILHGLAIFRFHILDIKPIAVETALNRISDGFLVLNNEGFIVSFNRVFKDTFGMVFGLSINTKIYDYVLNDELNNNIGIHTLVSSMNACKGSGTTISYEQSVTVTEDKKMTTKFYMVDVTSLISANKYVGYVIFFKDITNIKENMRELQNNQKRLMEREQLAFLGQMLGGISHNLKTPIMSISGSINAVSKLIEEGSMSLEDPEVTKEDYLEIYSDMKTWLSRMQDACSYMSEIITTVKGQATNLSANYDVEFTMDDVIKRVILLLRHELQINNCVLTINNVLKKTIKIHGDINSMVQVVNNLVGNAIDAMKEVGGGNIEIELDKNDKNFFIKVKDTGPGVSEDVRKLLFKQMVTSKGAMGSGLGIFISNSFIKARFDGNIWFEDNPGGGAVFGISLPIGNVELDQYSSEDINYLKIVSEV